MFFSPWFESKIFNFLKTIFITVIKNGTPIQRLLQGRNNDNLKGKVWNMNPNFHVIYAVIKQVSRFNFASVAPVLRKVQLLLKFLYLEVFWLFYKYVSLSMVFCLKLLSNEMLMQTLREYCGIDKKLSSIYFDICFLEFTHEYRLWHDFHT